MPALSHQLPTVSSHSAPTMLQLYRPYPEGTSLKPLVIQNPAMSLEANRKDTMVGHHSCPQNHYSVHCQKRNIAVRCQGKMHLDFQVIKM